MQAAIRLQDVSKKYLLDRSGTRSGLLSETLSTTFRSLVRRVASGGPKRPPREDFWALRGVDMTVQPGERIAVLGRNGAGKSTLLKLLSRITEPTSGRIEIHGRVASLLEIGTGFHPELTGRENIFLNGIILGMRKAEIQHKFDQIVQFAEIERFLDTPVKRYSSGMYVRLAFAVAAHVEADVLLVDEVLAVGDIRFQEKCLDQMREATSSGRTVLFVSHNIAAVSKLCSKAVVLDHGRVTYSGDVEPGIQAYIAHGSSDSTLNWTRPNTAKSCSLELLSVAGSHSEGKLRLALRYRSTAPHPDSYVTLDFVEAAGTTLMQAMPTIRPFIRCNVGHEQEHVVEVDLPGLIPGTYEVSVWHGPHNTDTIEWWQRIIRFIILESPVPERTFPHPREHGFMIAKSRLVDR